jgi:tRNA(Ile)-lysidine synthase
VPAADAQPVTLAEARNLFAPFADLPTIALAVSGGPDSTALLWLASRWRASRKVGPELIAITVDHGLRPEARGEAVAVGRLAQDLGVEHRILRWTGAKPRSGIQEAARNARFALIAHEARTVGARHVLTAHTLDDQAETVLFRLLRGSGLAGLQAMAEVGAYPGDAGLSLARPFLTLPKARLVATLENAGIPYVDDPSNRDPRHTRPRLRQIIPLLVAEGLTAERLATLAKRLQRAETALRHAVAVASARVVLTAPGDDTRIVFDRALFDALPAEIALRLLAQAVGHAGNEGPVELGKLESLFAGLSDAPVGAVFRRTLAGAMITANPCELVIERAPPRRKRPTTSAGGRIPALTTRKAGAIGAPGTR